MDKDFHYYGTFCAARIAGYNNRDASEIAFYAQFVDDCTETFIGRLQHGGYRKIVTCQTNSEMIKKYATSPRAFQKEELWELAGIWCPFHFLPGNEGDYSYEGPVKEKHEPGALEMEPDKAMRLLCLPKTRLFSRTMGNLVRAENPPLSQVGMAMHILADAWAHQYFAGIPSWWLNEVEEAVHDAETGERIHFLFGGIKYTPTGPRYDSLPYLGHGRMGSLPDEGHRNYRYLPNWRKTPLAKDNREEFREAFLFMVQVMQSACGQGNRELSPEDMEKIEEALNLLTTKKSFADHCKDMEGYVRQRYGRDGGELPSEAAYQAKYNSLASGKQKEVSLEAFFEAAAAHRDMVMQLDVFDKWRP